VVGILGGEFGLPAGETMSQSTVLDLWDQVFQTLTNRYWLSNVAGFEGWRDLGFNARNDAAIDRNKGFIVTVRLGQGSRALNLVGLVTTSEQVQVVQNDGYTLAASAFPVPVSLDQSGLLESGFEGGLSAFNSDRLIFFNPDGQQFDTTVWYNNGAGTWQYQGGTSVVTRHIMPGEAFLIRRRDRAGGDLTWTNPVPYTLP
jgi:hypothetical protein